MTRSLEEWQARLAELRQNQASLREEAETFSRRFNMMMAYLETSVADVEAAIADKVAMQAPAQESEDSP